MLLLLTAMSLSACGDQKKITSKILVKVNGDEITARQLDAELWHANGTHEESAVQQLAMRKQAMEALIDRQVLLDEALRNKIDRDPKVMQIIERFKTQAIVQAYLESRAASLTTPSKAEIGAYFQAHPELFAHRKVLDVTQLTIAAQDFSGRLKSVMDSAKSLDQVVAWLKTNNIAYVRTRLTYTSADLPPNIIGKLQSLGRNRLFVMKDGERDLLCALTELRDSPVTPEAAAEQIERFLFNKKMQEAAAAEIAHLRSLAKLDYVDKSAGLIVEEKSPVSTAPPTVAHNENAVRDVAETKRAR